MGDGTVYDFEMSSCETSDTTSYVEEGDFYDISGTSADGAHSVSFGRAPYGDGTVIEVASLEGEDPVFVYTDVDGSMALTVAGGNVSGSVSMSSIGPNEPHGAEVEATVDVDC